VVPDNNDGSHWHFDHTGDPSGFPPSVDLIVGPGFKDAFLPGYPTNEKAMILESDYEYDISFTCIAEKNRLIILVFKQRSESS
jgi:hypothetical protein